MCLPVLSVLAPPHLDSATTHTLRSLRKSIHQGMVIYMYRQCSALTLHELAAAHGDIGNIEKMQESERAIDFESAVLPIFKAVCVCSSIHSSVLKHQRSARVEDSSMQGMTGIKARDVCLRAKHENLPAPIIRTWMRNLVSHAIATLILSGSADGCRFVWNVHF